MTFQLFTASGGWAVGASQRMLTLFDVSGGQLTPAGSIETRADITALDLSGEDALIGVTLNDFPFYSLQVYSARREDDGPLLLKLLHQIPLSAHLSAGGLNKYF